MTVSAEQVSGNWRISLTTPRGATECTDYDLLDRVTRLTDAAGKRSSFQQSNGDAPRFDGASQK